MGVSTKEKGVLKLVHPGRRIEYYFGRSVTAGEILKRNPRHSITRTDFFKYPYVVVRPESVLVPGQVFYVVPNKTVYKLVKSRRQLFDQESPQLKSLAGRTPMHKFNEEEEGSSCCEEKSRGTIVDDNKKDDNKKDDIDELTFRAREFYLDRVGSACGRMANHGQEGTNLKSCMKKEGRVRTSGNLRVRFDFSTMVKSVH